MNVLFFCHFAGPSGAQKCIDLVLDGIDRSVIDPVMVVPSNFGDPAAEMRSDMPVERTPMVWCVSSETNPYVQQIAFLSGLAERVESIREIIRRRKPDLIVSNTSVILEPALAAAMEGIPHVHHVLEVVEKDDDLTAAFGLNGYLFMLQALSQRIICVSSVVRDHLIPPQNPDGISIVHTGLKFPPTRTPEEDAKLRSELGVRSVMVMYAGVLSKRKGVHTLASAIKSLTKQFDDVSFLIAGNDIGEGAKFREDLKEEIASGAVQMLGRRNDVLNLLSASDIVVVPSLIDPLPVIVLESMSCGKAIVATKSGGCEDMIVDGESGLLVAPGDHQGLATAIRTLIEDPALRERYGAEARQRLLNHFSFEQYVSNFQNALLEVAQQPADESSIARRRAAANLFLAQSTSSGISLWDFVTRFKLSAKQGLRSMKKMLSLVL